MSPEQLIFELAAHCGAEIDTGEIGDHQVGLQATPPTFTFSDRELEAFAAKLLDGSYLYKGFSRENEMSRPSIESALAQPQQAVGQAVVELRVTRTDNGRGTTTCSIGKSLLPAAEKLPHGTYQLYLAAPTLPDVSVMQVRAALCKWFSDPAGDGLDLSDPRVPPWFARMHDVLESYRATLLGEVKP